MEAIKTYLESMFARLPNTPEVWKAKDELLQMMEDRYSDLIQEGKNPNEAVGAVIAEFGNLDEVAESLGIETVVRHNQIEDQPEFTLEDAEKMIKDRSRISFLRGLAVFLFIISPVGFILFDSLEASGFLLTGGLLFMFACIAAGVGLLVFNSVIDSKWHDIRKIPFRIDYMTASEIYDQKEEYRVKHALFKAIGIILIVISFVPAAVIDELRLPEVIENVVGGSSLLILVGIGVLMLIYTSGRNSTYDEILRMNDRSTIAGSYVPESDETITYSNETLAEVMSVYWHTVTCIYLIWSFLTFHWWITWIIWPVAAIIRGLINSAFGTKER